MRLILALIGALTALVAFDASADERLDALRAQWRSGDYLAVIPALLEYRDAPYGRTAEVDYMLGTALCRVPQFRRDGAAYLARTIYNYVLPLADVAKVRAEEQRCGATALPGGIVFTGANGQRVGVSGKTYFWASGRNALTSGPAVSLREIPASEFAARRFGPGAADAAVAKVRALVGAGFVVRRSGSFVLAAQGNQPEADLRAVADTFERFLRFFVREYDSRVPDQLITVYLVDHLGALQTLADKVHGIRLSPNTIAYSFRDDLSVAGSIPATGLGSLVHELAHLIARHSFGDVPAWLDEGLAALYEVSTFTPEGRVVGVDNWRRPVLNQVWDARPSLAKLVEMSASQFANEEEQFELKRQAANHATARYLMLFLQDQGKLAPLYRAFRDRKPTSAVDPGLEAVQLLERVTGMSAAALDARFVEWFRAGEPPPATRPLMPPPVIDKREPPRQDVAPNQRFIPNQQAPPSR